MSTFMWLEEADGDQEGRDEGQRTCSDIRHIITELETKLWICEWSCTCTNSRPPLKLVVPVAYRSKAPLGFHTKAIALSGRKFGSISSSRCLFPADPSIRSTETVAMGVAYWDYESGHSARNE